MLPCIWAIESYSCADVERLEIEIGLVETVEEDEAISAGRVQMVRHVGEGGEGVPELDGDGDAHTALDVAHEVDVHALHVGARELRIGRNEALLSVPCERWRSR